MGLLEGWDKTGVRPEDRRLQGSLEVLSAFRAVEGGKTKPHIGTI